MGRLPYRQLIVWQKAYRVAMTVFDLAEGPAFTRRWFFKDQMCRAAMAVPANVAEGNGRSTPLDYASFLDRARGSVYELDTWLLTAAERRFISEEDWQALEPQLQELGAMLFTMANQLRRKDTLGSRIGARDGRQRTHPSSPFPHP